MFPWAKRGWATRLRAGLDDDKFASASIASTRVEIGDVPAAGFFAFDGEVVGEPSATRTMVKSWGGVLRAGRPVAWLRASLSHRTREREGEPREAR